MITLIEALLSLVMHSPQRFILALADLRTRTAPPELV